MDVGTRAGAILNAVLLAPVIFASVCLADSPQRGYIPRANGFDLNDNGVIGEAGIDDRICDDTVGSGIRASDIDGDGQAEEQIYVDCDGGGLDFAGCGGPDNPCATITYAFNTRADGPGDNAEDIVCFTGTCTDVDGLNPAVTGVPGFWTKPRSGSEVRDWQFPANPAMLVGWDKDGDNAYPPFDADDTAVLDGGAAAGYLDEAFSLDTASYLEFAHFSVLDYGHVNSPGTHTGFMDIGSGSHKYVHDIEATGINKDRELFSSRIFFDQFGCPDYFAAVNLQALETGAWFIRGSCGDLNIRGPLRWQNISYTAHGQDGSGVAFTKIWGWGNGYEFLDSVIDANLSAWTPCASGGDCGARTFGATQCTRDWMIRNNEVIDMGSALTVGGHASGFCDEANARTVDDIVFDKNIYRDESGFWDSRHVITFAGGGGDLPTESIEDITITNNFLSTTSPFGGCFYYSAGNDGSTNPGTITFANNTCHGEIGTPSGALHLENNKIFQHQNWIVRNNIFSGLGSGDLNLRTNYAPSNWDSDYNAFDRKGGFIWNDGAKGSLSAWSRLSAGDTNSRRCSPQYSSPATGDFHLLAMDTCARDRGTTVAGITDDIDGDPRPLGVEFDIGADESRAGDTPTTVRAEITLSSIGASDGRLRESGAGTGVGGSSNSTAARGAALRVGDDLKGRQWKAMVSFDTSQIPNGAEILSATLRLRRRRGVGANPFDTHGVCFVDVATGGFGGEIALRRSDFEAAATVERAAALSKPAANGRWSEAPLDFAGLKAINKTGKTQLRTYFEQGHDGNGRSDYIGYSSGDHPNLARRPQLVVIYRE